MSRRTQAKSEDRRGGKARLGEVEKVNKEKNAFLLLMNPVTFLFAELTLPFSMDEFPFSKAKTEALEQSNSLAS